MSSGDVKPASKPGLNLSARIKSAVKNLAERGGSSQPAIKKYINENEKDIPAGEVILLQPRDQFSQQLNAIRCGC